MTRRQKQKLNVFSGPVSIGRTNYFKYTGTRLPDFQIPENRLLKKSCWNPISRQTSRS